MKNVCAVVQVISMGTLAVLFWKAGAPRLAVAQVCYGIATAFLFFGVK